MASLGPFDDRRVLSTARRLRWTLGDGWVLAARELEKVRQEPGLLAFPAVLVLLFGCVFGSAIRLPGGGDHRE